MYTDAFVTYRYLIIPAFNKPPVNKSQKGDALRWALCSVVTTSIWNYLPLNYYFLAFLTNYYLTNKLL